MTWFKVDDKFHSHRKVAKAGAPALGVWVVCASWAADQLTDGFVPDYIAQRFDSDANAHAERLVAAGLWEPGERDGDAGWWFHDWADHQPTREQVEAKREYEREKKRGQRRSSQGQFALSRGDTDGTEGGTFEGVQPSRPVPTRPDPVLRGASSHGIATSVTRENSGDDATEGFEAWWKLYPRKVGKGQARKAYTSALKKADADTLADSAEAYGQKVIGTDPRFIAHPATWLNGERWLDEPEDRGEVWTGVEGWMNP